jgi:hypothetical protein
MRLPAARLAALALLAASTLGAQRAGKFPPDSLVNTQVIPHTTPVIQVVGQMRNIASWLGVRCQYCHVGEEGQPLEQFNFTSDEKRTKVIARQMMLMVREINRRLDTLPQRGTPAIPVTCQTCHRGVSRPAALAQIVTDAAIAVNADSAARVYRALRERYYGRDSYDFGELTLNQAAFRVARGGKIDDALAILRLNEEHFPKGAQVYVMRGNILLMKADTAGAAAAWREAIRRDSVLTTDARRGLASIGQKP